MAGEDIDLKLIIKALLDSKGFEEAQTSIKALAGAASAAQPATEGLTKNQKNLTKELGGSRGAVADLTRVLLMNIGVTGPAGQVAKAAGIGMTSLVGAINPLAIVAAGAVAALAVLIPKLMGMGEASAAAREEQQRLLDTIIGGLPGLEQLAESIGHVSEGLERQIDATRVLAFEAQKARIETLNEEIKALREQLPVEKAILETRVDAAKVLEAFTRLEREHARALTEEEKKEELVRLQLEEKLGLRQRVTEAAEKGLTLEHLEANAAKAKADADRDAAKAARERVKVLADQIQLERDIFRESARRQQAENKDRAEARKKHDQDIKTAAERILQIEAEGEARSREVDEAKAAKRQEVADGIALSAQAAAALVGLFTKNKAINIAAAIADTFAAGIATLKATAGMGPWVSIPAMASVIAVGLANVERIRSAEVGFDDPFADLVARKMGRKSAEDFARHFGNEFSGRLPGAMAQATNVYNQTTINRGTSVGAVNYNSIVGARKTQQLKQLNRDLIAMNRLEDRTRIGR